uniref:Ribonuclease P protein component 1 n=1 Tax=Ignisphaera aggregans TaxID=334771 RepID=A0A7C2ZPV8_9CREN
MPLNKKNLIYHELIGLKIEVLSHSDPTLRGRSGSIVDETMYTLKILDEKSGKIITVPKLYGIFKFELNPRNHVIVDGTLISARPEDRLKKMLRK